MSERRPHNEAASTLRTIVRISAIARRASSERSISKIARTARRVSEITSCLVDRPASGALCLIDAERIERFRAAADMAHKTF